MPSLEDPAVYDDANIEAADNGYVVRLTGRHVGKTCVFADLDTALSFVSAHLRDERPELASGDC